MAPIVLDAATLRRVMVGFHGGLADHRQMIDNLNVYPVPDGDTGTNMTLTMKSVVESLDGVADDLEPLCAALSHGALMGARGNSGVILAQILRGVSGVFRDAAAAGAVPDAPVVAQALAAASEGAYSAVARPVEGTILTVIREASESAQAAAAAGGGLTEVFDAARERGYGALERTPEMLAVLAEAGVVDAGGAGLLLLFDACLAEIDGRPMPEAPEPSAPPAAVTGADVPAEESSIADLRYEVMFLLDAPDPSVDGFKAAWQEIGDSIVVVGGDGIWNCHIHTDDIGAAVEAGIAVGRPHRIQVTDLLDQAAEHSESFAAPDQPAAAAGAAPDQPAVEVTDDGRCSVVAVGAGAGVVEILMSMGADRVVTGGQSMNPSTAELLAAVDSLPTGHVVVLPNNKNIIGVAEQVDGESERTVGVVPTRSVVEGIASLLAFSPGASAAQNSESMAAAAAAVTHGEVTQAVRDASSPAGPIAAGDWLGIGPDGIAAVASGMAAAATALLSLIVDDGHELLTVLTGTDADAATTDAIVGHVAEHFPDVEVEVTEGGQPLYPYFFGLE
ncbi:MAG: DAK2 domain-containing protein [Acidimicrobiaceae bacterium]|nr:DAK2 domain-containing protein [Acidimicrobiaceae bacterium]MYE74815.1 DAK2 domain-containing protein [Acidimicrobiaceae bacterium]MYJ41170.1 DAK2 domain-containing protein [Acidimicrobiaceae bacterium]MYJ82191.1 DAK2 domain-containing protein [Acidimicrobiaceae bacterium]